MIELLTKKYVVEWVFLLYFFTFGNKPRNGYTITNFPGEEPHTRMWKVYIL